MKEGIHPTLNEVVISCACGHQIKTLSTGPKAYAIEICSHCHPFFTGKHKLIDSAGRVERFQKKYANFKKKPKH